MARLGVDTHDVSRGDLDYRSGDLRGLDGAMPELERESSQGWLEYLPDDTNWRDAIRLVDDDGMPFVMGWAKQFHGKEVQITIEVISKKVADIGEPSQPDRKYFKFSR